GAPAANCHSIASWAPSRHCPAPLADGAHRGMPNSDRWRGQARSLREVARSMNIVERGAPAGAVEPVAELPKEAPAAAVPDRKPTLRPLALLVPYVRRYRGRAIAALCALIVAAVSTLVVPLAVRRMIDFGFSRESVDLIDSYFSVMIGVVAVLAL